MLKIVAVGIVAVVGCLSLSAGTADAKLFKGKLRERIAERREHRGGGGCGLFHGRLLGKGRLRGLFGYR